MELTLRAIRRIYNIPKRVKTKKEPLKETTEKKNSKGGPLGRILESSGGSSGIGSDHPPSPDQNGRYLDNHSTSGEYPLSISPSTRELCDSIFDRWTRRL
ncbi:hypothetical protein RUM43_010069 [Polyplax serrata]|uniref:Uncharacterized protein n=1 Tax=Polyplax serrata TaxID=468196 RepID=A0AAN8NZT9_POLSC